MKQLPMTPVKFDIEAAFAADRHDQSEEIVLSKEVYKEDLHHKAQTGRPRKLSTQSVSQPTLPTEPKENVIDSIDPLDAYMVDVTSEVIRLDAEDSKLARKKDKAALADGIRF